MQQMPFGFLPPCLPIKAPQPPSGDIWLQARSRIELEASARAAGAAFVGLEAFVAACNRGDDITV